MIQDIINIGVSGGDAASPKQGHPQFKQNPPNIARGALWTCENVLEMEDAQALVRQALSMTSTYADVGTLCQVNNLQLMTQTARVRREALDIEVMLEEGQPEQPEFIAKLRDSLQSLETGTSELRQLTQQHQEDEPQGMDGCEHEEKSPAVTDDTSRCNLNAQEGVIQDIMNIGVSGGDTASPKQGYPQFKQNPPWEVNLDTALAAIEGIADAATHSVEITPRIHNVLQETIIGTQAYEEGIMANQMHIREVLGATVAMQAREDTGSMKGDTLQQLAKHRENLVDKIADISASIRDREDLRNDIRTQITTNTLQLTWQMYAVMTHGGHREIERRVELEIQRIILRDIVHLTTVEWERERWEPICIPKDNLTNVLVQVGISDVQAEAVNEWIDEAKLTTTIFDETGDETGEAWPQVIDSRTLFASITQDGIPQFVREAIRHVCELVVESDRGKALWAHGLIDTGAAGRQSRLMDTDTAKNSISEVNGDTVGEAWEATQMLFIKVTASKAINDLNRQTAEAGAKKEVESYKTATAKLNKTVLEKMKVLLHESLESQALESVYDEDTAEIRAQLDTVQSRAAMKTLLSIDTGPSISPQEWRKMIDDALSTAQWENTEVYESAEAQKYRRLLKNIIIQHTEFVRLTGEESQRSGDDEEEASQSEDDGMAASSQRPKATKRAPAKQDKSSQETKKQLKKRYEARERTRQDEYEAAMLQNRKEVLRAEEEALQAKIRAATAELDAKNQEVRMQHERLTQSKEDRGTKRDSRTEDTKWALASPPESRGRRRPAPSHHTTERERRVDWKKRWSTTMVPVRMMREIVRKYFDHIQQAPRHIPTEVLDTVTITTRNDKKGDISAVQAMMLGIETQVRYTPVTSEEIDMETVRDYWRQLQLYCREPHREMWQEYICGNEASATIVKLLTLLSGEGETSSQQRTQMRGGLRDYLLSEEPQTLGQSGVTWISISAQLKTGTGKHPAWETYGGQIRSMKIPREVRNKLQEVMPSARIGDDTPWPGVWTAILGAPMVEARAAAYTMYAMASELQFPKAVTKKYKEEAQKHMLAMVQEMADFVIQQIREQLETLCSKFSLKLADTKRLINGTGYVADTMEAAVNMLLSMDQTSLTDIMRSCTNENRVSHEMLETISQSMESATAAEEYEQLPFKQHVSACLEEYLITGERKARRPEESMKHLQHLVRTAAFDTRVTDLVQSYPSYESIPSSSRRSSQATRLSLHSLDDMDRFALASPPRSQRKPMRASDRADSDPSEASEEEEDDTDGLALASPPRSQRKPIRTKQGAAKAASARRTTPKKPDRKKAASSRSPGWASSDSSETSEEEKDAGARKHKTNQGAAKAASARRATPKKPDRKKAAISSEGSGSDSDTEGASSSVEGSEEEENHKRGKKKEAKDSKRVKKREVNAMQQLKTGQGATCRQKGITYKTKESIIKNVPELPSCHKQSTAHEVGIALVKWVRTAHTTIIRETSCSPTIAAWIICITLNNEVRRLEEARLLESTIGDMDRTEVEEQCLSRMATALSSHISLDMETATYTDGGAKADDIDVKEFPTYTMKCLNISEEHCMHSGLSELRALSYGQRDSPYGLTKGGLTQFNNQFRATVHGLPEKNKGAWKKIHEAYVGAMPPLIRDDIACATNWLRKRTQGSALLQGLEDGATEVFNNRYADIMAEGAAISTTSDERRSGRRLRARGGQASSEDDTSDAEETRDTRSGRGKTATEQVSAEEWRGKQVHINAFVRNDEKCDVCGGPHLRQCCWSLQADRYHHSIPWAARMLLWSPPMLRRVHDTGLGEHMKTALATNRILFRKTNEEKGCTEKEAEQFIVHCKNKNILQAPCTNPNCTIKLNPDTFKTRDAINDVHQGCDIGKALKAEMIDMASHGGRAMAGNAFEKTGDTKYKGAIDNMNYTADHMVALCQRKLEDVGYESDEYGMKEL